MGPGKRAPGDVGLPVRNRKAPVGDEESAYDGIRVEQIRDQADVELRPCSLRSAAPTWRSHVRGRMHRGMTPLVS